MVRGAETTHDKDSRKGEADIIKRAREVEIKLRLEEGPVD